jgi:hypothetical protein
MYLKGGGERDVSRCAALGVGKEVLPYVLCNVVSVHRASVPSTDSLSFVP